MDYLEGIFKKLWKTAEDESHKTSSTCRLKEVESYLKTWLNLLGEPEKEISLLPSLKSCGVFHHNYLLPEWINYFATPAENRSLYLLLVLQIFAQKKMNISGRESTGSRTEKRVDFLQQGFQVNLFLDKMLPGFSEFQKNIFVRIQGVEAPLLMTDSLFDLWAQVYLSRTDQGVCIAEVLQKIKFKKNDQVPDFLRLTCPELLSVETLFKKEPEEPEVKVSRNGSELENELFEKVQKTTLDDKKSQDNPVLHSFEKLETLDDYQGGYRMPCGEDQLQDHGKALKEVELSHMTTDGESSQSTYKSNQWIIFESGVRREESRKNHSAQVFHYGEWMAHKKSYVEDYCQVYQIPSSTMEVTAPNAEYEFQQKYYKLICAWQPKVDALLNQPLWIKKQIEGSEVDLDAHLRLKADLYCKNFDSEGRIFESKRRSFSDILPFFLIDQSLSTDSYVLGERVLDIFLDSTLLMGRLFQVQFVRSQVASFCSASHSRSEFTILKDSGEPWGSLLQRKGVVAPQGYTRLGPSLRHATTRLLQASSSMKILILLTDGKPTDVDGYEGQHGIQDVREAIFEAEKQGVRVLSFVVDKSQKSYYQQMFSSYDVIQNAEDLCEKLIRKLITLIK